MKYSVDGDTIDIDLPRKNCSHGHCGCYYTNGNQCCHCKEHQFQAKQVTSHIGHRIDFRAPVTNGTMHCSSKGSTS